MVTGLFPAAERGVVLDVAERSVVFLTKEATRAIQEVGSLHTAWQIANIYLDSLRSRSLGRPQKILGLNESQVCYVSMAYFSEDDPFADYVVHEVAHIFHNCKRESLGLRYTRNKEWLLDIAYRKRETFAYACEAYSRIIDQGRSLSEPQELLRGYRDGAPVADDRVEMMELIDILSDALTRRNGWRLILERCANTKPRRSIRD